MSYGLYGLRNIGLNFRENIYLFLFFSRYTYIYIVKVQTRYINGLLFIFTNYYIGFMVLIEIQDNIYYYYVPRGLFNIYIYILLWLPERYFSIKFLLNRFTIIYINKNIIHYVTCKPY